MITAERLEELIKQGATIYYINPNNYNGFYHWTSIKGIDLKNAQPHIAVWNTEHGEEVEVTLKYDVLKVLENGSHEILKYEQKVDLEFLFEENDIETKRAMWQKKTHATRIERFEPPMWEDMQEGLEFIDYRFTFTINGNCNYLFTVAIGGNGGSIEIEKFDVYEVEKTWLYDKPATKENYEKACEIVRDLFSEGGVK